jgi:hypothetical protein
VPLAGDHPRGAGREQRAAQAGALKEKEKKKRKSGVCARIHTYQGAPKKKKIETDVYLADGH